MRRLKTVRRPPIYPNGAQAISPVAPSPLFRCPHAVHRCPSVDSGLTRKWQRLKAARKRRRPNAATGCPTTMPNASSPLCALCQGYVEGYASGKQKAHDEVRMWELGAHEPDCGATRA